MTDKDEILDRFKSVELTPESWAITREFEEKIAEAVVVLLNNTRPGREQSTALTKLEEAKMWGFRTVAVDQKAAQ